MNIKDALSILGIDQHSDSEAIKTAYRVASFKFHPDRNPAGLEMMKSVNTAYQFLVEINYNGKERPIKEDVNVNYGDELNAAINAMMGLNGLIIEVCGSWIWLSGNTKDHKDVIKANHYRWARKKVRWYFRPSDYKSHSRGSYSMDDIRAKFGSQIINNETEERQQVTH